MIDDERPIRIRDKADFDRRVVGSERPVLVEFFKGGCLTCLALSPMLRQLAREYRGRVVFARFELMKPWFWVTSWPLRRRYRIALLFPTVLLLVGGEERRRWILNYSLRSYRKALDKVAGPPG
jgi:thioredoxin 1